MIGDYWPTTADRRPLTDDCCKKFMQNAENRMTGGSAPLFLQPGRL